MEHEVDPSDILDLLKELFEDMDRAEDECGPQEFFDSVRAQAEDMEASLEGGGRATLRRKETVENWKSGVEKWRRD